MVERYKCGIECHDGGKIHTLRAVSDSEKHDFQCLDCDMKVITGDRELGEQQGAQVL